MFNVIAYDMASLSTMVNIVEEFLATAKLKLCRT